jgi:hypothetical protein
LFAAHRDAGGKVPRAEIAARAFVATPLICNYLLRMAGRVCGNAAVREHERVVAILVDIG